MSAWDTLLRGAVVILAPGVHELRETLTIPEGCSLVGLQGGERVEVGTAEAPQNQPAHLFVRYTRDKHGRALAAEKVGPGIGVAANGGALAQFENAGARVGGLGDDAQLAGFAHGDGSGTDEDAPSVTPTVESDS